jgi:hypothetical protein
VIADKHYDIGNDLFELMLGKSMAHTCGYWPRATLCFMPIKKFFMQSHVLLGENYELLLLAAKAGCIGVFVGIESVSADTLSEANKGFNRVDRLKNNIARFHDRGIMVDGGIIFGFDTDTPDVFDRTIEALEKIRIDSVAVNILIPYPRTEFYKKFEKEGRIICTDYANLLPFLQPRVGKWRYRSPGCRSGLPKHRGWSILNAAACETLSRPTTSPFTRTIRPS